MSVHTFLHNWILPPRVYRTIGQLFFEYQGVSKQERQILSKNAQFHNKYVDRRCFVIGNGKSLNEIDLSPLSKEITITMNQFYRNPITSQWQPNFLCKLDSANIYQSKGYLEELYLSYTNLSPKDGYFFHLSTKSIMESFERPQENVFYIKTSVDIKTLISTSRDWDLTGTIPGGWSTSVLGMILGMYLGCKEIYLVGMDHDWLATTTFYSHNYTHTENEDPSYLYSYTDFMKYTLKLFKGYSIIKQYAEQRGIKILNATPGGFLDIFPRVDYKELMEEKQ